MRMFRDMVQETMANWPTPHAETPPDAVTSEVFNTAAELIVQQYIQKVFSILFTRAAEGLTPTDQVLSRKRLSERLSKDELAGLRGLSFVMVKRLLGAAPHIVFARARKNTHNGTRQVYFESHASGKWVDRVRELFTWDDHPDRKLRGWDREPFRRFARQTYNIINQEINTATADKFLESLTQIASKHLLIILQYDYDKLSVMRKGSKHHGEHTRAAIKELLMLDRTQWLIAQFPPHLHQDFEKAMVHNSAGLAIRTSILDVLVASESSNIADRLGGLITDPARMGINIELGYAQAFNQKFEDEVAETPLEESSEDDS